MIKIFNKLEKNKLRSLNTYYSHDVLGKSKYLNLRKVNKKPKFQGHSVPNYISYKQSAQVINTIDIGTVKNVPVVYREPAKFILRLVEVRLDKLKLIEHFPCKEASSFLFVIAVGTDGAPEIGMPVLISFIYVGGRIAISAEQFLLFGAAVDENSYITTVFFFFFEKLVCDLGFVTM